MKVLGKKIQELRKIAKETQDELAAILKISARQLHRYEHGELTPNAGIIALISAHYNYDFSKIISGKEIQHKEDDQKDYDDHSAIEKLLTTNAELVSILRDRLPDDQQQTNNELAATALAYRKILILLLTSEKPLYHSKEDAEMFLDKAVKQMLQTLQKQVGNKDNVFSMNKTDKH